MDQTNQQKFRVRTALMPLCYKDFHCLMGACRNNCCDDGWEISFSKKDYLQLKRRAKSKELEDLMSMSLVRLREREHNGYYAEFRQSAAGRCAFHTPEGLCRLQLECGEEALPKVCRNYPRSDIYTPAAREFSLIPSCEGVLTLLWDLPQGIDFWEEPLPKTEWRVVTAPDRYERFADIRSFCIDVLQERSLPFPRRMLLLGMLLHQLKESDWTAAGVVDEWLDRGADQLRTPSAASAAADLPGGELQFFMSNIRVLMEVYESAAGRTKEVYQSLFSALSAEEDWEKEELGKFSIDAGRYRTLEKQLESLLEHTEHFFENLMVMTAFYRMFPRLDLPERMWRSYVELCSLYSFYRFAAVLGCHQETSQERLFQVIGTVSRSLLHNEGRQEKLLNELFEGGNATLAHMAVLTGG